MDIYTSSRVMPYVYKLVHKVTGQFYIGSRYSKALKLPSHLDLPQYKTSSKKVKAMGFENFEWHIVAEFFVGTDAWDFEQSLIAENIDNPLNLNGHHHNGCEIRFVFNDSHTEETKRKMSLKASDRKHTEETKALIASRNIGKAYSEETIEKMRQAKIGKSHTEQSRAKMSAVQKGLAKSPRSKAHRDKISAARSLEYSVIHPCGKTEVIVNMKDFCGNYGLDRSAMSKVAKGTLPSHKGFRCIKMTSRC